MTEFRYKAFISYSHGDSKYAVWLHRAIETYRLPGHLVASTSGRSSPGKVFRDVDDLGSAASLTSVIRNALDASECLIVICSPGAVGSQWVAKEIVYFRSRYPDRPVLPLVVGEDILSSMPVELRHGVNPDGSIGSEVDEPLAAFIKEGRRNALTRIVAGMLGLSFDDLRQRDLLRRQKRLLVLTTGSVFVAGVAIAVAMYALEQRNRAERETAVAQQVTGFLVDLFEASDPYEEVKSDLTVRDILDRGAANIDRDLQNKPELQARLLATIGKVHTNLGSFEEAGTFLDRALEQQRAISSHGDPQILRIQIARAWLASQTDNLQRAQQIYDEILPSVSAGQMYSDILPLDPDWINAVNDLGVLQWIKGDYTSAKITLQHALTMAEAFYGQQDKAVTSTLNNLGLVYAYATEHDNARLLYERALAIEEKVHGENHPLLLSTIGNLAATVRSLGDLDEARLLLERGLNIATASFDEGHNVFAFLNNGLGIVLYRQGKYVEALDRLEYAGTIYLQQYGPSSSGVAANLQHQARVFRKMGNLDKSKLLYEQSAEASGSYGPGTAREMAGVLEQMGDIEMASRLHQVAIEEINKALPDSHPLVKEYKNRYDDFRVRNELGKP